MSVDLMTQRGALEAERARLLDELDELEVVSERGGGYDGNLADSGSVTASIDENRRLVESLRAELEAVDGALARIAEGSYGTCEVCGAPIADARLEALPQARRCIRCA